MLLAHAADLHFGVGRGSNTLPDYLERTSAACRHLVASCLENKVDALLVAGDLFHRRDVKPSEIGAFITFVMILEHHKLPTFIMPGNHDKTFDKYTLLDDIADIEKSLKYVQFLRTTREIEWQGIRIMAIHPEDNDELEYALQNSLPDILMYHGPVNGCYLDNGMVYPHGRNIDCTRSIPYVALGDIHKRQRIGLNAVYPGSPYQTNFGEAETKRGYCLVELDDQTKELKNVKFVDLDQHSCLTTIRVTKPEDIDQIPKEGWISVKIRPGLDVANMPANVVKISVEGAEFTDQHQQKLEESQPLVDPLDGFEELVRKGGYEVDSTTMAGLRGMAKRIVETVGTN